jgi:hypothetical protein
VGAPRTSSCSPWINGDDVKSLVWVQEAIAKALANEELNFTQDVIDQMCAEAADMATSALYDLSGRQFSGLCGPVTIRPSARPTNADSRGWISRGWSYGSWGAASMMTMGMPAVVNQYGDDIPPVITINNYPVRTIDLVKIDGVVIPPDEYELREFKHLIRMRPTANFPPTERWGWPTSQRNDLPDTEFGTFSITYTFGADPGSGGRLACKKLAEMLLLPQLGDSKRYPTRVASINRQGVSANIASITDAINQHSSGIYEVDFWLMSVNPTKVRRQALVWSPDRAPNRRQAYPSTS